MTTPNPGLMSIEAVCGAVRSYETDEFVAVRPRPISVPDLQYRLWDFVDDGGDIRAVYMELDEGETSPVWRIDMAAGNRFAPYAEATVSVAGAGRIAVAKASGAQTRDRLARLPIGGLFKIEGGDMFQFQAIPGHGTLRVLSVCIGAPFLDDYEARLPGSLF